MEDQKKRKYVYNQKKNEYTQQYIRDNYKQLSIRLPITGDVTRDTIAAAAAEHGESVNGYIVQAVRDRMEKDQDKTE